jgi:hypothetical protein
MPWLGMKRIAFIPVDQKQFNELPVPPDWRQEIEDLIYFKRDSLKNVDVSLRDYIYTTSYGRADLEGVVLDTVDMPQPGLPLDFVRPKFEHLKGEFDAAAVVQLGRVRTGQGECGYGAFWAWFNMYGGVGLWAMELTHVLASYWDLYTNDGANDLNSFDNMCCDCGTHPTAYTKMRIGWLDSSAIAVDTLVDAQYDLHSVGLVQPPPSGRSTAVQIETSGNPLFVEARQRVDQYDGTNMWNGTGVNNEGVIVYELAGEQDPRPDQPPGAMDPLIRLWTQTALKPGESFTYAGVTVNVVAALAGGFRVRIVNPNAPSVVVPDLYELSPALAANELENLGLVPRFTGLNTGHSWVRSQSPFAGHSVALGSTVTMVLTTGPIP